MYRNPCKYKYSIYPNTIYVSCTFHWIISLESCISGVAVYCYLRSKSIAFLDHMWRYAPAVHASCHTTERHSTWFLFLFYFSITVNRITRPMPEEQIYTLQYFIVLFPFHVWIEHVLYNWFVLKSIQIKFYTLYMRTSASRACVCEGNLQNRFITMDQVSDEHKVKCAARYPVWHTEWNMTETIELCVFLWNRSHHWHIAGDEYRWRHPHNSTVAPDIRTWLAGRRTKPAKEYPVTATVNCFNRSAHETLWLRTYKLVAPLNQVVQV